MRSWFVTVLALLIFAAAGAASAQGTPNAPSEIKLGQTMPYSGPASAYGVVGKASVAYFEKLNKEQGGINGRKVKLISLDDGYSPPKTVEQTRKLVEQDNVLAIFGTLGTPTNTVIHRYLNDAKVPQILLTSGAHKWADPARFPWTMPGMISYQTEGAVYGRYLRETRPGAKVAILRQNDDFGKDYAEGFRRGLGEGAKTMIVAEATYEVTDPTIGSQLVTLRASGADAFFMIALGKFSSQAIKRAAEIGWKPREFFVPISSMSVKSILEPAGLENAVGLMSANNTKTLTDKRWDSDAGMVEFRDFVAKYMPEADPSDSSIVTGYNSAMIMAQILRQCGDDLSRANVMRQAAALRALSLPMLLPGFMVDTGPDDYLPYQRLQLQRFDGSTWTMIGEPISD